MPAIKRFTRITSIILGSLFALLAIVFVFLQIWYVVLERDSARQAARFAGVSAPIDTLFRNKGPVPEVNLLPYPVRLQLTGAIHVLPPTIAIAAPGQIRDDAGQWVVRLLERPVVVSAPAAYHFIPDTSMAREAYRMDIAPETVKIHYGSPSGLYYALVSLKQLKTVYGDHIPCMQIEDHPALPVRGVMLDISRDKVPQLSTLFRIVDYLADLKINHLQLYVEGFSFGYPSFRHLWEGRETPLTPEEIRELDAYCRDRFIDLAANHNTLGHMAAWLATEQYAGLAECPEGYAVVPFMRFKTTLDPCDPRSLELVQQMTEDLLPNFSSGVFNVNLDEPFELGKCKSRKAVREKGVEGVYLEYTREIHSMVQRHGREMWMWGDILARHPEAVRELPDGITILEWGYEYDHPFESRCRRLSEMGRSFIVCPGTSSWTSLGGRTENMLANIDVAVRSALKYGARGMLLTDWGDMGHWQYLPVSYAGFAWGAALSWNPESGHTGLLEQHLSRYAFRDKAGKMGGFVLALGRFNQFEEFLLPNMTHCMLAYQFGIIDHLLAGSILNAMPGIFRNFVGEDMLQNLAARFEYRQNFRYRDLMKYLSDLGDELAETAMETDDAALVRDEFQTALAMIRFGADIRQYISGKRRMDPSDRLVMLESMRVSAAEIERCHRELWVARNKPGGLDRSLQPLMKIQEQIDREVEINQKGLFARSLHRLVERGLTAAAALFLN
jgi:hexosaminidase